MDIFSRTRQLLGQQNMQKLSSARAAVFGLGGVGGYVVEALARSGVGAFVLVDHDKVSLTNINRQIIAAHNTIGRYKTDVMRERILSINPNAVIEERKCFYLPENAEEFDFTEYSYVVDAVDTVTAKIEIIMRAQSQGVPVISSMGTGNKLDPSRLQIADIYQTSVCPLAKVMRRELRKRGVKSLKVVYSTEPATRPKRHVEEGREETAGRQWTESVHEEDCREQNDCADRCSVPGSIVFVPAVAGLLLAGEVVKDLIEREFVITEI